MATEDQDRLQRSAARDRELQLLVRNFPGFKTRGRVLSSREGVTGEVYQGEYLYQPVAVKIADRWSGPEAMFRLQQERDLLLNEAGRETITFQTADKSIKTPITSVTTSLVKPVREIMQSPLRPPYVLVTHLAPNHRLYTGDTLKQFLDVNGELPFSLHMATWLGFTELLKNMKQKFRYFLDTQTDDLTIGIHRSPLGYNVDVVKLDCTPAPLDNEAIVTHQIAENMHELYSRGRFTRLAAPVLDVVKDPPHTVEDLSEQLIATFNKVNWEPQEEVRPLMDKLDG